MIGVDTDADLFASKHATGYPEQESDGTTRMTDMTLDASDFTLPADDPETWQTSLRLPEWEAMGENLDPTPRNEILLAFEAKGEDPPALTLAELTNARWFTSHAAEIMDAAMQGLLAAYPDLIESFGYDDDERSRWMPDMASVEQLRRYVRPTDVTIHASTKDGLPYIGILFECSWDPEHGTGAMLHGTRVVAAGEADHARDGELPTMDADQGEAATAN